jgi:RNA polymerase sigma factor (TIGR02999 family)
MSEATRIFDVCRESGMEVPEDVFAAVYTELRRLAAGKMALEQGPQTLQPTALVHEAWIRLYGNGNPTFQNRQHFFGAAAEAMRRILVDRARAKQALKRGGGAIRVDMERIDSEVSVQPDKDEMLIQIHEALADLAAEDPREAEIVKLRFFAGMTDLEIAAALEINERTVRRYWAHAKPWLYARIKGSSGSPGTLDH